MGVVIQFTRRRAPPRRPNAPVSFFFDLASPFTYFVAERLDRRFCDARWRPVPGAAVDAALAPADGAGRTAIMRAAERRAAELQMPLVWPDRFPVSATPAMRATTHAVACGRGPAFAIAIGRLAFCGGFDMADPQVLADAAAAAGLDVDATLAAAADERRDRQLASAGRALRAAGCSGLPAIRHPGGLTCGEGSVAAAIVALPSRATLRRVR